jgi:hypothetical protein
MTGGKVLYTGVNQGYDGNVVVQHDDGVIRRYAMHGSYSVRVGQRVEQGDKLGVIARRHLHYEEIPPTLNGRPNPVYQEMINKQGEFVSTSGQRGVRDPNLLPKGSVVTAGKPFGGAGSSNPLGGGGTPPPSVMTTTQLEPPPSVISNQVRPSAGPGAFTATTPHNYPANWYINADYEQGLNGVTARESLYRSGIKGQSYWRGEQTFKEGSEGENAWLSDQMANAVKRGSKFVEPDNVHERSDAFIERVMKMADEHGLKFVGKNLSAAQIRKLGGMKGKDGTPIMVGNTFELDVEHSATPSQYEEARRTAGSPNMPGRWVAFGKGEQGPGMALGSRKVQETARETAEHEDMATHWAPREYSGSEVVGGSTKSRPPRSPRPSEKSDEPDRSGIDRSNAEEAESGGGGGGDGGDKVNINVKAPRGTTDVEAKGSGKFENIEVKKDSGAASGGENMEE